MNHCEEKAFDAFENDVQLYYSGKRLHNYAHHFGPYDRDTYIIYYIKEGKARLCCNGGEAEIAGQGLFVNFPHSQAEYHSVATVPWSIKWMVADGTMLNTYLELLGVTREHPFLPLKNGHRIEAVLDEIYDYFDRGTLSAKAYCISLVHKLFSLLFEEIQIPAAQNSYVRSALSILENRFHEHTLSVASVAQDIGLNANYFSVLFKKETGKTPVKVLGDYRLAAACKMLKLTNKPIKTVAYDCGFSDELYFSRAFKRRYGIAPKEYRNEELYLT